MDLTKLIDLLAEVAVRRATQKEAKDKPTPDAVGWMVRGLRRFTRASAAIYASMLSQTDQLPRWCR